MRRLFAGRLPLHAAFRRLLSPRRLRSPLRELRILGRTALARSLCFQTSDEYQSVVRRPSDLHAHGRLIAGSECPKLRTCLSLPALERVLQTAR